MPRILVIDDDPAIVELVSINLEMAGYDISQASDGIRGQALAVQMVPDLIVLDLMLPKVDGFTVCQRLRRDDRTADIPVLMLTALGETQNKVDGFNAGADDYLTKPCTVEQLLSAISTRLQRHQEIQHPAEDPDDISIFPDCPKLETVFQFIDRYYHQPIHLSDVASAAGYSPAYLTNLSQNQTGRTIKKWITERRMVQARQLLKETSQSIKQIAEEIGYGDAGYFTRQFRKLHGTTPNMWRRGGTLQTVSIETK